MGSKSFYMRDCFKGRSYKWGAGGEYGLFLKWVLGGFRNGVYYTLYQQCLVYISIDNENID